MLNPKPLPAPRFTAIQRGWQHPRRINRWLYPLSLLYAAIMRTREIAYRAGIFKRHKLPCPLIVIGNLSVGGVGKTPLLIELATQLKQSGFKPGIITRGYYGRRARHPREVTKEATPAEVGDEPILIWQRCQVPVVADANRTRAAKHLLAHHPCDILLSDDGFQHLALKRDMDIVVVDGERRFGNGWCLPAGPLREPRAALRRATCIVLNNPPPPPDCTRNEGEFVIRAQISQAHRLRARPTKDEPRDLAHFADKTIHAVAGIGNPERFFQQLHAHRLKVIAHPFPDHHRFTARDFAFAENPATIVLMTEKDAVKCAPLLARGDLPNGARQQYWQVPLQLRIPQGLLPLLRTRAGLPPANNK